MFHHVIYCSLPWNQSSFVGYFGEIIVDIMIFIEVVAIDFQFLLLFTSLCAHFFTFNEMFASFVIGVDSSTEEKRKTECIRKVIQFHLDIKGCVRLK